MTAATDVTAQIAHTLPARRSVSAGAAGWSVVTPLKRMILTKQQSLPRSGAGKEQQ